MATEHPRQHVWCGDDHTPLITFLIMVVARDSNLNDMGLRRFLVKSNELPVALLIASKYMLAQDEVDEYEFAVRPLRLEEAKKISLIYSKIIEIDEDSYSHLIENGE